MNLRELLPTSGPGYTDHPRADIEAHRSVARSLRWMGIVGLLLFGVVFVQSNNVWYLAGAGFAYLACSAASSQMRLEALEWEVEVQRGGAE